MPCTLLMDVISPGTLGKPRNVGYGCVGYALIGCCSCWTCLSSFYSWVYCWVKPSTLENNEIGYTMVYLYDTHGSCHDTGDWDVGCWFMGLGLPHDADVAVTPKRVAKVQSKNLDPERTNFWWKLIFQPLFGGVYVHLLKGKAKCCSVMSSDHQRWMNTSYRRSTGHFRWTPDDVDHPMVTVLLDGNASRDSRTKHIPSISNNHHISQRSV